jgi:CheY-like chemotaxis protein
MMMEVLGYEVVEACHGKEALELLEQHPDLDGMITDLSMPVMRGDELAARARVLRPDLPIMMLTAFSGSTQQPNVDLLMPKPPTSLAAFQQGIQTAKAARAEAVRSASAAGSTACSACPRG